MANVATDKNKSQYHLNCIEDGLTLLRQLFAADEGLTLTDLCQATGITKNKTFRLLNSFEGNGVVDKDLHMKYSLGGATFLTARKIAAKAAARDAIQPILVKLAGLLNESVYFAKDCGGYATLVEMADCRQMVRVRSFVGSIFPEGGRGKTVAADGSGAVVAGITVAVAALDPEVTTVSIEISCHTGMVTGSLVVIAPTARMSAERISAEIIPLLQETVHVLPQITTIDKGRAQPVVLKLVPKNAAGRAAGSAGQSIGGDSSDDASAITRAAFNSLQ